MEYCLDGFTEGDVLDRIQRFNPGWKIIEHRSSQDGEDERCEVEAILEEDITLKPFTYINRELGSADGLQALR
jgi:hypothetical protein